MEVLIAIGAAVTVIGAVVAILYNVGAGDPQVRRLEKLEADIKSGSLSAASKPVEAKPGSPPPSG